MKAPFVVALFAGLASGAALEGQTPTVGIKPPTQLGTRRLRDTALVNALNNAEVLASRDFLKQAGLSVRIIAIAGPSGSARDGESDEVASWLYVALSEFGELPDQRLYRIGPVYAPTLDSLIVRDSVPVAFVAYGLDSHRRHARIEISLDSIRVRDAAAKP